MALDRTSGEKVKRSSLDLFVLEESGQSFTIRYDVSLRLLVDGIHQVENGPFCARRVLFLFFSVRIGC